MTWLNWRLHRNDAIAGVILFAGLIGTMWFGMRTIETDWDALTRAGCLHTNTSQSCQQMMTEFWQTQFNWDRQTGLLHAVPIAIGAMVAIPTLFEFERGTLRLAWTQGLARPQWLISRLGFVFGITVAVAIIWAVVAAEWRERVMRVEPESFGTQAFILSPVVLIAYCVFATALALSIGSIIRKAIPAIVLMGILFVGMQALMTTELRENLQTPVEETGNIGAFSDQANAGWQVDWAWLDAGGDRVPIDTVYMTCSTPNETAFQECVNDYGFQQWVAYQPAERFRQFQLIEAAIYLGLSAALVGLFSWRVLRRPA